jgi:hypothetical protein
MESEARLWVTMIDGDNLGVCLVRLLVAMLYCRLHLWLDQCGVHFFCSSALVQTTRHSLNLSPDSEKRVSLVGEPWR